MFLKIMRYIEVAGKKAAAGKKRRVTQKLDETQIYDCVNIGFREDKTTEGAGVTRFFMEPNTPKERVITITKADIDKNLYAVYILNEAGKTIQQPV